MCPTTLNLENFTMTYKENYRRGLIAEAIVAVTLQDVYGYNIMPSSKQENTEQDIDFWAEREHPDGSNCISISVKDQERALVTGNFSFELEQQLGDGQWVKDQGYHKCQATCYAIKVGPKLYVINRIELANYVDVQGWGYVTTLSPAIKETQVGRKYVDAKNGLLRIAKAPKKVLSIHPTVCEVGEYLQQTSHGLELYRNLVPLCETVRFLQHMFEHQANPIARKLMATQAMAIMEVALT